MDLAVPVLEQGDAELHGQAGRGRAVHLVPNVNWSTKTLFSELSLRVSMRYFRSKDSLPFAMVYPTYFPA